jgi:hypothetical protein
MTSWTDTDQLDLHLEVQIIGHIQQMVIHILDLEKHR